MDENGIILDDGLNIPIFSSVCTYCKHLRFKFTDYGFERKCDAFPEGIPMEIWLGKLDHKTPYKGDNGILFERKT